jgi:hypothetical protein
LFQSMILMAGDQESLPPALRHVMAGRGRFMRASEVPKSTQQLVQPVVVAGLRRVSARHHAGSLRSTETTDDDKLRRDAATDLMGKVGGALVASRVVPGAGGNPQW